MNTGGVVPGQGPGQPSGGAGGQQPQQKRPPIMYRPEQMRALPEQFTAQEKEKWEMGLRSLWSQIEKNGPETPQHQDAKRKLMEFSRTLTQKMQTFRQQQLQQMGQQGGQQAGGRPASQGQAQAGQGNESNTTNPNVGQQQVQPPPPQSKIPQKIMEHVSAFPYVLPPNLNHGTPEAANWLKEIKGRYLKGLVTMDQTTARIMALDAAVKKRNEEGKPLSSDEENDVKEKKELAQRQHSEAKAWVDKFRNNQQQQQRIAAGQQGNSGQPGPAGNGGGQPALARPQLNPQQVATNPVAQNTQTVAAAMEAARNQQMGGARPLMQQNGQPRGPNQAPSQQNIQQQQGGQVQIKVEAGAPPPINTAIAQIQQGQRGSVGNNSPQSGLPQSAGGPQSATTQTPRALNHQQALQTAARTYSSGQTSGTPNVMGHSHTHPSLPRETPLVTTNKMPIPKHLSERAAAPPQPVQMSQARPTFTGGPSNAGNGVMSQPVLQKVPAYNMESDGDRVLSKKKLDELVRQVTGGGEGLGSGEALTPEVEESILDVADNFVDQVLQAACKNAKERGSKILEIRDIQLTLERGYNIRIPGYASDEIRTVRKIQPAPAWISKMSAVQAAKVTGGKSTD